MRHIDEMERRARLGTRHWLASPRPDVDVAAVAGDLAGLHATDPVSIFLAARARTTGLTPEHVERAMYDDRTVLKTLAMRRTMFVIPSTLTSIYQAAASDAVAAKERRRLVKWIEEAGTAPEGDGWLQELGDTTVRALEELGPSTVAELTKAIPALATKLRFAQGKAYAGEASVGSRIVLVLAAEGRIARSRPLGSWISTQYRWASMASWLGEQAPRPMPVDDARAQLAARWLRAFGPATEADFKWWTGWTVRDARSALSAAGAVEVALDDGVTGWVAAGEEGPLPVSGPWVALLPALDPTPMGWQQRDWYLGPHKAALFDTNGNIGPTIWVDGRIAGGWAQRKDGAIVTRLLDDVGREAGAAIDAQAGELEAWLGDTRFTPRFRTPLERQLTS